MGVGVGGGVVKFYPYKKREGMNSFSHPERGGGGRKVLG